MLRWLFRRAVGRFERQWKYDASYLREIVDVSPRAAWRFSSAVRLSSYRRDVPLEAWVAAGLTAVRSEDCGPCTQLGTSMAERQGVGPEILRAILQEDVSAMSEDAALAWRFTKAVLAHDAAADDYRAVILERWGPRALVSLAFAITAARIYPTVKYAMGHGKACTRIVVGGAPVAMDRRARGAYILTSVPGDTVKPAEPPRARQIWIWQRLIPFPSSRITTSTFFHILHQTLTSFSKVGQSAMTSSTSPAWTSFLVSFSVIFRLGIGHLSPFASSTTVAMMIAPRR
jgi:hypothetical protein